jgi:hypothetical protein
MTFSRNTFKSVKTNLSLILYLYLQSKFYLRELSTIIGTEYSNFSKLISAWETTGHIDRTELPKTAGGTKFEFHIDRNVLESYLHDITSLIRRALELKKVSEEKSTEIKNFCEELLKNIKK